MKENTNLDDLKGKFVEVAGNLTGMVVEDNKETLLVRQAHYLAGDTNVLLMERAVFVDRQSALNAYWIKFLDLELPVASVDARGEIRDLFYM